MTNDFANDFRFQNEHEDELNKMFNEARKESSQPSQPFKIIKPDPGELFLSFSFYVTALNCIVSPNSPICSFVFYLIGVVCQWKHAIFHATDEIHSSSSIQSQSYEQCFARLLVDFIMNTSVPRFLLCVYHSFPLSPLS